MGFPLANYQAIWNLSQKMKKTARGTPCVFENFLSKIPFFQIRLNFVWKTFTSARNQFASPESSYSCNILGKVFVFEIFGNIYGIFLTFHLKGKSDLKYLILQDITSHLMGFPLANFQAIWNLGQNMKKRQGVPLTFVRIFYRKYLFFKYD